MSTNSGIFNVSSKSIFWLKKLSVNAKQMFAASRQRVTTRNSTICNSQIENLFIQVRLKYVVLKGKNVLLCDNNEFAASFEQLLTAKFFCIIKLDQNTALQLRPPSYHSDRPQTQHIDCWRPAMKATFLK